MGKASQRKRLRRTAPIDRHLPNPDADIANWVCETVPGTEIQRGFPGREADYWHALSGRTVQCDLCYRRCVLKPGEAGWCKVRCNQGGRLKLTAHGVLGACFHGNHNETFLYPDEDYLYVSGTSCTAGCSFCTSTHLALAPERLTWVDGIDHRLGTKSDWSYYRAVMHPHGVIARVEAAGVRMLTFSGNEPTLNAEFVFDTARLAKKRDFLVILNTNCYTTPEVIRSLAPFVDGILAGIKGNAAEHFYVKHMRSPGAAEVVRTALVTWQESGVPITIHNVIPNQFWVPDDQFEADAHAFYQWVVRELGPLTPCTTQLMVKPQFGYTDDAGELDLKPLLPKHATVDDLFAFVERQDRIFAVAREEGIQYILQFGHDHLLSCHQCGGTLVHYAPPDLFELHATNGRCDHCGTVVPIVTKPGRRSWRHKEAA